MPRKSKQAWQTETIDISEPKQHVNGPVKERRIRTKKLISFLKANKMTVVLIAACLYIAFVVFGMLATRFYTNELGNRQAYAVTFKELQYRDDYKAMKEQCDEIRKLLVSITATDIHLANGDYSDYEAAVAYGDILEGQLNSSLSKVGTMELQKENEPIREKMGSMLQYNLKNYLSGMVAVLGGSKEYEISAVIAEKTTALSLYEDIISDIKLLSEALKYEDDEFFDWELQQAVSDKAAGAVLNK